MNEGGWMMGMLFRINDVEAGDLSVDVHGTDSGLDNSMGSQFVVPIQVTRESLKAVSMELK